MLPHVENQTSRALAKLRAGILQWDPLNGPTATTGGVVNARREELLRKLVSETASAKSPEEACALAANALATDRSDIPFALIYLLDWDRQRAELSGSTGIRSDSPMAPQVVDLREARNQLSIWYIAEVAQAGVAEGIFDLSEGFGSDLSRPWPEDLQEALVVPMRTDGQGERVAGVLVAGVSQGRALSHADLSFYYSVRERIENAVSIAHAKQEERRRRAELEDQLRHSRKMEETGRLACGAVHDLNNLLTMIYGYSDLVAEQLSANDRMREDVALIGSACERAMKLTRHLLAFSQPRALEIRALDLNKVIADVEPLLRGLAGRNIKLVTVLSPVLDYVLGDAGELERVVMNLVANTRDAMPHGGRLVLETSQAALGQVREDCRGELIPDSYVLLSVSDTGIGMDKAVQGHLFEPFFTTKAPGAGTGLGLATAYDIVRQSGGTIWVESEPGMGTTFKVSLPCLAKGDAHGLPASSTDAV